MEIIKNNKFFNRLFPIVIGNKFPKHPHSSILYSGITNKNNINTEKTTNMVIADIMTIFLCKNVISIIPINISIVHNNTDKTIVLLSSSSMLNNLQYSLIFKAVPKGSMPLMTPEKINKVPIINCKISIILNFSLTKKILHIRSFFIKLNYSKL